MIRQILATAVILAIVYGVGATVGQSMAYTGGPVAKHYATVVATTTPAPVPTVSDGTWRVGRDMAYGWWRAPAVTTPDGCHWQTKLGRTVIEHGDHPAGRIGPVVRLEPGLTFTSRGCGTWEKVTW
jgi:hypothetical protein